MSSRTSSERMRPQSVEKSWSYRIRRRLWASLGLAIVLVALALDVLNRYEPIGIDFHTYLAAARVGMERGWSLIYDQNLVAIEQKWLVPDQIAQPFLSPPTDAWLTAPLIPLPYWVAYWIWAAITLAALGAAVGVVIALVAFGLMGSQGVSAYLSQLRGPLPEGANNLTLEGAFGVGGWLATALRAGIVLACLAAAFRLRHTPGLVIAVGAI